MLTRHWLVVCLCIGAAFSAGCSAKQDDNAVNPPPKSSPAMQSAGSTPPAGTMPSAGSTPAGPLASTGPQQPYSTGGAASEATSSDGSAYQGSSTAPYSASNAPSTTAATDTTGAIKPHPVATAVHTVSKDQMKRSPD